MIRKMTRNVGEKMNRKTGRQHLMYPNDAAMPVTVSLQTYRIMSTGRVTSYQKRKTIGEEA